MQAWRTFHQRYNSDPEYREHVHKMWTDKDYRTHVNRRRTDLSYKRETDRMDRIKQRQDALDWARKYRQMYRETEPRGYNRQQQDPLNDEDNKSSWADEPEVQQMLNPDQKHEDKGSTDPDPEPFPTQAPYSFTEKDFKPDAVTTAQQPTTMPTRSPSAPMPPQRNEQGMLPGMDQSSPGPVRVQEKDQAAARPAGGQGRRKKKQPQAPVLPGFEARRNSR